MFTAPQTAATERLRQRDPPPNEGLMAPPMQGASSLQGVARRAIERFGPAVSSPRPCGAHGRRVASVRLVPGPVLRPPGVAGALDPVLGRLGSLEVRLAATAKDIREAQRLRFRVFYEEMAALPNAA